jgi:hypothetical protein
MIELIRDKIVTGQFEFSQHAVDQIILRHVEVRTIVQAAANGQIIEDYPEDK